MFPCTLTVSCHNISNAYCLLVVGAKAYPGRVKSCSLLALSRVNWAKSVHVLDVIVISSTNSVSKNSYKG